MTAVVHLAEQASQIVGSLGGDVVEVNAMADAMCDGEQKGSEGNDLVEADVRIEWNVVVDDGLPQEGDEVTAHCEQQDRICEHHA